jgi:hypothetical protein
MHETVTKQHAIICHRNAELRAYDIMETYADTGGAVHAIEQHASPNLEPPWALRLLNRTLDTAFHLCFTSSSKNPYILVTKTCTSN